MSNGCELGRRRLLNLAAPLQIMQTSDAAGRCLSVSLDLALAAQQKLRMAVSLVRWRIVDDPAYVDHWAVMLDEVSVIDLTRVQVDGVPRLVNPLSHCPANFTDRRIYPASLLTGLYRAVSRRRMPDGGFSVGLRQTPFEFRPEQGLARPFMAHRDHGGETGQNTLVVQGLVKNDEPPGASRQQAQWPAHQCRLRSNASNACGG